MNVDPISQKLEDLSREIREFRRDLYGDPQIRQKGVYDRLEALEERVSELRMQYEQQKVGEGFIQRLETEMDQLRLDYRLAIVYLRGIGAAVGAIVVTLLGAAVVAAFRFLGGA